MTGVFIASVQHAVFFSAGVLSGQPTVGIFRGHFDTLFLPNARGFLLRRLPIPSHFHQSSQREPTCYTPKQTRFFLRSGVPRSIIGPNHRFLAAPGDGGCHGGTAGAGAGRGLIWGGLEGMDAAGCLTCGSRSTCGHLCEPVGCCGLVPCIEERGRSSFEPRWLPPSCPWGMGAGSTTPPRGYPGVTTLACGPEAGADCLKRATVAASSGWPGCAARAC